MRHSKEIMILLALFVAMAVGTLWYVIDRRAKNRARPPAAAHSPTPGSPTIGPALPAPGPVALGTKETEGKTIDFSSGAPVVKDSPEDRAAMEKALKEIAEATQNVKFGPAVPPQPAPAAEPKKP